jgi:hypothetical protein
MKNNQESLPADIAELLAATPKISKESLSQLKTAAEELENDPAFQADCIKGLFVENILQAMNEDGVKKSQLAKRLKKTRQYLNNLLNEEKSVNFSIETLVKVTMALDRRIELHVFKKNEAAHVLRCTARIPHADTSGFDEQLTTASRNALQSVCQMPFISFTQQIDDEYENRLSA